MKIRINGKEYDWGTIKIIMWGRPVVGATSVDYKLTKAKEALYAQGVTPKASSTVSGPRREL